MLYLRDDEFRRGAEIACTASASREGSHGRWPCSSIRILTRNLCQKLGRVIGKLGGERPDQIENMGDLDIIGR
jgi:hypothetical protein